MNIQEKIKSKGFQIAVLFVGVIFVALVSFAGGVAVGLKKARFSYKFGENYERNFGMMPNRPMFGNDNFPNAHGAIG
ncbi:MAG: hypothetical protein UW66_C0015G0012, partial [Candidatus Moranbacteria bacterium GW2011_GWF1_44_4]